MARQSCLAYFAMSSQRDFQSSSFWKGILLTIEISFRKLRNRSQKSAKWGTFSRVKWIVLDIIYHHYPPFNLKNVIQNVASSHMKPNHRPFWHFWHFWKFPWFWTSSNKNMSAQTQSSHRPRHQKRVKLSRLNEWLIVSILQMSHLWVTDDVVSKNKKVWNSYARIRLPEELYRERNYFWENHNHGNFFLFNYLLN